MPDAYESQFTKEERNLLNAITERVSKIIKRIQAEEMLRAGIWIVRAKNINSRARITWC
jgi:hypothetical protein